MKNKELIEQLDKLKKQIYTNSKDAHFAETLVDELLKVKGQMGVEPLELNVGKKLDEWKGETFSIVKTDRGVLYNEHGHYAVFADPNMFMYATLEDFVDNKDEYAKLEGEDKETFEANLQAIAYSLGVPKLVFNDPEFLFKIANDVVEWLLGLQDKMQEMELQDETPQENAEFENATIAFEDLKEEIKKENKKAE